MRNNNKRNFFAKSQLITDKHINQSEPANNQHCTTYFRNSAIYHMKVHNGPDSCLMFYIMNKVSLPTVSHQYDTIDKAYTF